MKVSFDHYKSISESQPALHENSQPQPLLILSLQLTTLCSDQIPLDLLKTKLFKAKLFVKLMFKNGLFNVLSDLVWVIILAEFSL